MLLESIADTTVPAEVAQVLNFVNFAVRYNWAMSDANLDIAKKLGLTDIKKYWRCASQVEIELEELHG